MADHLAIVSSKTLRQLLRRPTLTWKRRRREAPVGRVHVRDRVFFKLPGGPVAATADVGAVRQEKQGVTYLLTLRFRGVKRLPVPFPILKRDRRSWIVCASSPDARQQRLLSPPSLSLEQLLREMQRTRRALPSRRSMIRLLASWARQPKSEGVLLLWLALLACSRDAERSVEDLRSLFKRPPLRVVPFAVFS